MVSPELVPLAFLHAGSGSIDGSTRFQKLVFLAQQETAMDDDLFEYEADRFGPFSVELAKTLNSLENRDLIEKRTETNRSGDEMHRYRITDRGRQIMNRILTDDDYPDISGLMSQIETIKREYDSMSLDELLRYVYRKYPRFTEESELEEYKA